MEGANV
jgi:small subunit ribosomal protein S29